MTPHQFAKIGEALYGPSWRGRMAQGLTVSERTIHRWASEGGQIPDGIKAELTALCRSHAERLTKLADQLEGKVR